jgi:thiamine biosynthesis lipoprotein
MIILVAALQPMSAMAQWYSDERAIMGTSVRVELWHEHQQIARRNIEKVMHEMHRIDEAMSPYKKTSDLSRVNRSAALRPQHISDELFSLIEKSIEVSRQTDGAFDITFASVGHFYDFRKHEKPGKEQLQKALPAISYRHIKLDPHGKTISFTHKGTKIDLGGIAKGYAVDRAIELLKAAGISHAIVSAGGDSRIIGDHRGRPWVVGIRDPRNKKAMAAVLPISNSAISTSGDYERYFEQDGIRYHHIISPKTGTSASSMQSATVIGSNATTTDALSTSVFVLGVERGMALVNSLPGIEAVIIDASGNLHFSAGIEDKRKPSR